MASLGETPRGQNEDAKPEPPRQTLARVKVKKKMSRTRENSSAMATSDSDCLSTPKGRITAKEQNCRPLPGHEQKTRRSKSMHRELNIEAMGKSSAHSVPRNCVKISRYEVGSKRHTELRYVSYSRQSDEAVVKSPLSLCDLLAEMVTNPDSSVSKSSAMPSSPILLIYLNMARIAALRKVNEQLRNEKTYVSNVILNLESMIETKKNFDGNLKTKNHLLSNVVDGLTMLADEKIECDAATAHLRQGTELQNLIHQMGELNIGLARKTPAEQREILQRITKIRQSIAAALTSGTGAR